MARPIVVLGQQRSGTTVFRELLASSGARDLGEVFHAEFFDDPEKYYWFLSQRIQSDIGLLHPDNQRPLFREFLREQVAASPEVNAILDVKSNAMRLLDGGMFEPLPSAVRILTEFDARFVQVIRRNKLRVHVSEAIAQLTGIWRQAGDQGPQVADKRVQINAEVALHAVESSLELDRRAAFSFSHPIYYEDMFDEDGAFSEIARETAAALLDVEVSALAERPLKLAKQNPEPLRDIVENYDELGELMARTPHEWMLAA